MSAATALSHRKLDINLYAITSEHVAPRFRRTIAEPSSRYLMHPDHHQPIHEPRDIASDFESTHGKILATIQTILRSQPETTSDPTCKISGDPSPSIASKQHQSRANPSQFEQRYIHPKPSGMAERDPLEAVRPAQRPVRLPRQH
uniref:Uncharacterized protein n=1 Tax=Caenorhabditis japonica TaxID=281687 RepID=A0A8R1ERQ2_CAEJA